MLASPVIGADETRWRLLDGRGRDAGEATNWQAWAVSCPTAIAYQIHDSRSTKAAKAVLGDFAGTAMTDGYAAYGALQKQGGKFRLAHCWTHVRRKYEEIESFFPAQCGEILDLIGKLYEVEKACPTGPPGDDLRRQLRNERSREILSRIHKWALETRALPESGLGKAIAYMAGLWPGLTVFVEDPRVPLDNNGTERGMRGLVTKGSLCVTPSSARKVKGSLICGIVTRAAATPGACAKRFLGLGPTEVVGHNLPRRVLDDLARRKHPALDQAPDRVVRDAELGGSLGHREAATVLVLRFVAGDAVVPSVGAHPLRGPRETLARGEPHAIERRGDVLVAPCRRHLADDSIGLH